jgi:Zn ribbon nucleic-acid-binding protein
MDSFDRRNVPTYLIILSLIILYPLGVYYLVLKTETKLKRIKRTEKILKGCEIISLTLLLIHLLFNFGDYVSLFDSHMNFDMYSFKFIYVYLFGLMIMISSLLGYKYLNKITSNLIVYTEYINVKGIRDIDIIADETLEDELSVRECIDTLINKKYIQGVELSEGKTLRNVNISKEDKNSYVKCNKCGNYMFKKKHVVCDFCDNKIK